MERERDEEEDDDEEDGECPGNFCWEEWRMVTCPVEVLIKGMGFCRVMREGMGERISKG